MGERRAEVGGGGGLLSNMATIARLLPTSVVTGFARQQAGAIDFATSNMRGAPFDVYIAGARLLRNVTLGPVAGTAFNMTCLSMGDHLDIGMHIDPVAVADPASLRECMERAYAVLLAAGQTPSQVKKTVRKGATSASPKKRGAESVKKSTTKLATRPAKKTVKRSAA